MGWGVRQMPPGTLVDVVNAWGTEPRRARGEAEAPWPDAADVAVTADPVLAREPVDRLVALADALYPAFVGQDDDRAALVTRLLERSGVRPAVLPAGDGRGEVRAGWVVPDGGMRLLAAAAVTLWQQVGSGDGDRLGTCADHACADAFVDTSPAGHRRFCSVTCQNRSRAASFRRRHRHPALPGPP